MFAGNFFKLVLENGGGGSAAWLYTQSHTMSTVVVTGILVNTASTSRDANIPCGLVASIICKKSSVEFVWSLAGKYGVMKAFISLEFYMLVSSLVKL